LQRQPAFGHRLHPRADERQRLPEPEEPEVPMALKGLERVEGRDVGRGHSLIVAPQRDDLRRKLPKQRDCQTARLPNNVTWVMSEGVLGLERGAGRQALERLINKAGAPAKWPPPS